MAKLIILSGPPASGKTTFANKYIEAEPGTMRVGTLTDAMRYILAGRNVVLDPDGAISKELLSIEVKVLEF